MPQVMITLTPLVNRNDDRIPTYNFPNEQLTGIVMMEHHLTYNKQIKHYDSIKEFRHLDGPFKRTFDGIYHRPH